MSFKEIGMFLIILVLVEGAIAICLSHGINGRYFKNAASLGDGMRRLRLDKPVTAKVIGTCYALILVEVVIAILIKLGS